MLWKGKNEIMKQGDFVGVHLEQGCVIGKVREVRDGVVDIEFDNGILIDVPIEVVTPWVTV